MLERVVLVSPRGSCAGVTRAIATVERALDVFPPPVYVRRSIVHNHRVVDRLAAMGARFVDDVDNVPVGAVVVFSAHGVSPAVRAQAKARRLRVVDATCPLVHKVHREVRQFRQRGYGVVVIGHAGHDEVVGTLGQAPGVQLVERPADVARLRVGDPGRIAYVTQTTLSPQDVDPVVERLRDRFPGLAGPTAGDICFATRNRQAAVSWLATRVDVVLVVGDDASSNSRRLQEIASANGRPAHLIGEPADLREEWLVDVMSVGVAAGASTPEDVVTELVRDLCARGAVLEAVSLIDEHQSFALPRELDPPRRSRGSI